MPFDYSRRLTGTSRTVASNRHLGIALSFIAGAINAGGFLAIHQYTSHMTGVVSSIADNLAVGTLAAALAGLSALLAFIVGSIVSTILVNFSRQRKLHSQYAFPLLLEAILLLTFGVLGIRGPIRDGILVSQTIMLLSFIMGLQNAVITKLSSSEIRTTHVTGMVTDIGIEIGKFLYRCSPAHVDALPVVPNGTRLRLLCTLVMAFFSGGIGGALGFKHIGYISTLPLSFILIALAIVPVVDDLRVFSQRLFVSKKK